MAWSLQFDAVPQGDQNAHDALRAHAKGWAAQLRAHAAEHAATVPDAGGDAQKSADADQVEQVVEHAIAIATAHGLDRYRVKIGGHAPPVEGKGHPSLAYPAIGVEVAKLAPAKKAGA